MIRKSVGASVVLLFLAAGTARADLPAGFDWSERGVSKAAARADHLASANPDERARAVAILLDGSKDDRANALEVLARATSLDRFKTLRTLDRSDATTVRKVHDSLDKAGQARLITLAQEAGRAGTAAGLQQLGIVSDCDDTAFPTSDTRDGPYSFKGSGDFYRLVSRGTDGAGDPGNLHYVTARLPLLFGSTRARLKAAGVPLGTFDGNPNVKNYLFGGLDGIQASKIANIDLWLKLHPGQRFVFLGDTVQRDPEVYRWVLKNHPDQVELVLIHKAGGPDRNPADYKGEIFFGDYAEASRIVRSRGIVRPGARLAPVPTDLDGIPAPDTDVAAINAAHKSAGFFSKVADFFKENVVTLWKRPAATPTTATRTRGFSGVVSTP